MSIKESEQVRMLYIKPAIAIVVASIIAAAAVSLLIYWEGYI
jgi:hypothetical protein